MKVKKIIQITVLSLLLIFLIIIGIKVYSAYRLQLVDVCVASHNISQRKIITKNDLKTIKIPRAYILEGSFFREDDILGKYVRLASFIPKGSPFYKTALETTDEIKDYSHHLLKKGEATYDLFLDEIKANPAHLAIGLRVDLYLTIKGDKPLSDILIKNARIIGIYDNNNELIKDFEKNKS